MYPIEVETDERAIKKLTNVYKKANKQIIKEIETATDFGVKNRKQILAQVDAILKELGKQTTEFIKDEIPRQYESGAVDAEKQLKNAKADVPIKFSFNKIHKEAVAALVSDTAKSFGDSMTGVKRSAQVLLGKATREAITQRMAEGVIKGDALKEVRKTIKGVLAEQGISALKDKGGKTWELDRYSEMLFRTKVVESRNRGMTNQMVSNGYDLVQVSNHNSDHDACARWEGKILSVTGETKGYPTLQEAEAGGLFHPNCKHAINALIPSLARKTKAYFPDERTKVISDKEIDKLSGIKGRKKRVEGTQMTLYRGTGKATPMHDFNSYGQGTYYSQNRNYAEIFGKVTKKQITLKNPLIIETQLQLEGVTRKAIREGFKDIGSWAKAHGHDAVFDKLTEIVLLLR